MLLVELHEQDPYTARDTGETDPSKIAAILKSNCSEFIAAYKQSGKVLFRGVTELRGDNACIFASGMVRPDRRPIFMRQDYHELIAKALKEMGIKARRDNSLFCTGSKFIAKEWGTPYILFVENGWTGSVCRNIKHEYVWDYLNSALDDFEWQQGLSKDDVKEAVAKVQASKPITKVEMIKKLFTTAKLEEFSSATELAFVTKEEFDDVLITGKKYYVLKLGTKAHEVFEALGVEAEI